MSEVERMARPDAPAPAVPTSSGSQFRAVDYHYCLFDLDHTIVRYNLVEARAAVGCRVFFADQRRARARRAGAAQFLPFLYDVLRKSLVQLCKYPAEVLQVGRTRACSSVAVMARTQEPYEFTYGQKGLLVDWAHGNLVKLDRRRRPTVRDRA